MNRWLRIVLGVGAAAVVLYGMALAGLLLWFNPNDYKPRIKAAIEREIGRQVTIDGPIRLSIFPSLGIELGRVTVANAPGFGKQPIAELDSADARIRLLPLLVDRIRVGTLSLNGLHLRLERHADGRSSWHGVVENLIHRGRQAAGQSSSAQRSQHKGAQSEGRPLSSLRIGSIKINNAEVDWDDAASNTQYQFKSLALDTGRLSDGHPFRLEFSGDLLRPSDHISANINVVSSIEPHLADRFYRFTDLGVNILIQGASIPGGEQEANISAAGEIDLHAGRFSLDNITLQSAGATLKGKIAGDGLNSRLSYNGRLTIPTFSPRSAMQQLEIRPARTRSHTALTSASFDAQFEGGAKSVLFKQINASLDESKLSGTARIDYFKRPSLIVDLDLDQLNVDDYLPPASARQAQTSEPPKTGGGDPQKNAEFNLAALRDVELDGHVRIGALTIANVHVGHAAMHMKIHQDRLDIAPLTADLYGGRLDLTGSVDASSDTPRFALAGSAVQIDLQPLMKDVAEREPVSARGDARLDVRAHGKQVAQLKRSLTGQFSLALGEGSIHGVNLANLLEAARAAQDGGDNSKTSAIEPGQSTAFSRLDGHFHVHDGLMSGDDLTLITPHLTAHGAGRYDIPNNHLDYTIRVDVPGDSGGQLTKLAGLSIPLRLQGPLLAPHYTVDLKAALKSAAGDKSKAGAGVSKQEVDANLNQPADDNPLDKKAGDGLSISSGKP
ncbi:MAG: AsmA family protein [Salinisphaera sp.]|jgi:AsmA protein|nr:AsmA family protein [Salinisphaera sp.]